MYLKHINIYKQACSYTKSTMNINVYMKKDLKKTK